MTTPICHLCNTRPAIIIEGDPHACQECQDARQQGKREKALAKKLPQWQQEVGIPPRYRDVRIDPSLAYLAEKSLYLMGPTGTGKTHTLVGLAVHKYFQGEKDTLFVTMIDLLDDVRQSFDQNSGTGDSLTKYLEVTNLFLDDLGVEKMTDWVRQTIDRIINHRYNWMLPTYLSSNLTLGGMAEVVDMRVASRIAEMCEIVELTGKDRRVSK